MYDKECPLDWKGHIVDRNWWMRQSKLPNSQSKFNRNDEILFSNLKLQNVILPSNIDTKSLVMLFKQGALFRDGPLAAALQKPCINPHRYYGCSNNIASALNEVSSPAETFSTQPSASNEANNLTVLTDAAEHDVSDRQQETAFNDAAAVSNDESVASTSQLDRFTELQSIIRFLERPTVLWQSRIDTTNTPLVNIQSLTNPRSISQTPLKTFTFPYDLMLLGGKSDKIRNFEWFKTDIRLRILINANPFVAGRLYVTYSPVDDKLYNHAQINRKGRVGVTSYPGVEIDLQTNTAAELLVPWINEADAAKTTPNDQKLFRVDIWLLTPLLVSDNSLKIPITVFGSFANISLKFPTPLGNSLPTGVSQMSEAKGPISEIASGVGKVAGRLATLPVVGTIASKAKWASDIVGGVASIFGWSRPIDGSNAQAFAHIPGRGMAHFKAKDTGNVLGISNDNEIAEETMNFVSDVDEMSIEHICSRPGLVDVVDWSTNQDFNTQLSWYNCSRETIDNTDTSANSKYFSEGDPPVYYRALDPCLAEYVLDNFHMYRADWHFRISLVKTAFHVGRLEFVFIPNVFNVTLSTTQDTTNAYRQIFDITEQNEFEFVIPYNHRDIMFRKDYQDTGKNPTIGTLYIRVNSPLTCPDTVSQNIKILVWKYATNVAVAYPTITGNPPAVVATIPTGVSQINVTNDNKNVKYVVFDDENNFTDAITATKTVAGENCVSLREATRAFRRRANENVTPTIKTYEVPNMISDYSKGYLGVCANIFYFYRGGLSYKFVFHEPKAIYSYLAVVPNAGAMADLTSQETLDVAPFHFTPSTNPVHEISVPFYSQTRRRVCNENYTPNYEVNYDQPYVVLGEASGAQLGKFDLFLAGKDDLTFGFLIGAPVLLARFYK